MSVRVRYAPSPTGMQHIGGVRTALFNYLFARSQGGSFILRLEDTDRTRYDEAYVQNLYDTLNWLGIEWDEGGEKAGDYGPYVQSERFDLYKKAADELIAKGEAYHCFCNEERLSALRTEQIEKKSSVLGYDRHCRELSDDEVKKRLASGEKSVIRLKIPLTGETHFQDALLGDISWKNSDMSPDPVLLKTDGFPTYHLANVVDDHYMQISHVMRAQEWIPSTPLHVRMYHSFGWEAPVFCHLPMVNGSDGQKLSKRHGATNMNEFRSRGYLPQAIINYVAMLGCSYEEGRDLFPLEDLERLFKIEHLNKAGAVFDYKKLEWFNGQYIRLLSDEALLEKTLPFITGTGDALLPIHASDAFPAPHTGPEYSGISMKEDGSLIAANMNDAEIRAKLLSLMPLIKERPSYLTEAAEKVAFIFKPLPEISKEALIPKKLDECKTKEVLSGARDFIRELFLLDEAEQEQLPKSYAEKLGVKLGDFMMPLRIALTASKVSPPLVGSIIALGEKEALLRLEKSIALLSC